MVSGGVSWRSQIFLRDQAARRGWQSRSSSVGVQLLCQPLIKIATGTRSWSSKNVKSGPGLQVAA
jgi:hypothetical protein